MEEMPRASTSIIFSCEGRGMRSAREHDIGGEKSGEISNSVRSKVNRELEKYSGSLDLKKLRTSPTTSDRSSLRDDERVERGRGWCRQARGAFLRAVEVY